MGQTTETAVNDFAVMKNFLCGRIYLHELTRPYLFECMFLRLKTDPGGRKKKA
jgi:hypothetical protein